ncbi:Uncharacterized protein BP5553_02770 [Venustampulla echinocandica]|uniref:ARS binding protein 2 n=1 Tax=Venustampulla echinocandica TaxID=2656787 RepID=A0A370TSC6_9HELO|nr:Uncharacterized protein BP5553_02770 [Venustampulla echinocandica]RDL38430.1 Uncharacterized protein BP5553_02770 [Venustampulla echinocandica]
MPPRLQIPTTISETPKHLPEQPFISAQVIETRQADTREDIAFGAQQTVPAEDGGPPTPLIDGARLETRVLPSREVTDDNFDDAYVNFIMHCNPAVALDTDASELRKTFRAPPKSDGKSFSTYTLFELISKLERKEIKTWAQLAIDLGVEPPALDRGQSAQKVQQYAVRLKRWMHAMHVDAFFEYLLSKPHVYWTQVPSPGDPNGELGRDGVVPEEDLALRALLPETRPKRGRRKAEDRDNESDTGKSPAQRPRLESSPGLSEDFMMARASIIGDSATPASAHPGFAQSFQDRIAPWSATEIRGSLPSNFRWNGPDTTQTPLSAYPQSAITPSTRRMMWNDSNEPQSAITPKSRSRRRHGPAVSSAWPSSGGTSSGKLRGRPSSTRSVTDGPFSTFPVNPTSRDVPTISLHDNTPTATPVVDNSEVPRFFADTAVPNPQISNGRPSRLQLQVPQRQGGPVRLATPPPPPPPPVLFNGHDAANMHQDQTPGSQQVTSLMEYFSNDQDPNFQHFVSFAFRHNDDTDRTNMDALESHFICEILAAEWIDASGASIERCTTDEADKICKEVIKNLQAESSSTETFLINLSALAGGPLMTRLRMTRLEQGSVSHYECYWKMRFGSIEGSFTIRASIHHEIQSAALNHGPEPTEESWKKRYLDLRQQIRERDAKVAKLRRGVLDALVVSNQFSGAAEV